MLGKPSAGHDPTSPRYALLPKGRQQDCPVSLAQASSVCMRALGLGLKK